MNSINFITDWIADARAEIATANTFLRRARHLLHVRHIGFQPGFGRVPGRDLYNIAAGQPNAGSTVTLESLRARGLTPIILDR